VKIIHKGTDYQALMQEKVLERARKKAILTFFIIVKKK
jgi:hypothetical protein